MSSIKVALKFISLPLLLSLSPAHAEIITDGSLGPVTTLQGPDYQIGAELGTQLEANLFHSFSSFNLPANETATFSGPDNVEYIIGRVTGTASTTVSGLLKSTIPGSQFWMINPNGWNQLGQVEIAGVLQNQAAAEGFATSKSIRLKDGGLFYASTVPGDSQLTSASPQSFLGVIDLTEEREFSELHDSGEDSAEIEDETALPDMTDFAARRALKPETNDCATRDYNERSHFTVSQYRGAPVAPDSWYSSVLPSIGFEPVPEAEKIASVDIGSTVRVSCNSSRCGIWENLPTP